MSIGAQTQVSPDLDGISKFTTNIGVSSKTVDADLGKHDEEPAVGTICVEDLVDKVGGQYGSPLKSQSRLFYPWAMQQYISLKIC